MQALAAQAIEQEKENNKDTVKLLRLPKTLQEEARADSAISAVTPETGSYQQYEHQDEDEDEEEDEEDEEDEDNEDYDEYAEYDSDQYKVRTKNCIFFYFK